MMFYTYAHYTKDTNEIYYIGKGSGRRAWQSTSRNKYWQHKTKKHGKVVKILALWETENDALLHEKLLISFFKEHGNITNLADEGTSTGCKRTEEAKSKVREKLLGIPLSQERKQKIANSLTGRSLTVEHAARSRQVLEEVREKQKKKVWCLTSNTVYESVSEASKAEEVDASSIVKACKGLLKKAGNKTWSYG